MSRHPEKNASANRTFREWALAALTVIQRRPVIAGTLIVTAGYGLMNLGWRDAIGTVLVYCLGAYVLAVFSRNNGRAVWLFRAWNLAFVVDLGVKAFLGAVYKSPPDAAIVIEGISNTTSDESAEFLLNYWMLLGTYTLQLSVLALLLILATHPTPGRLTSSRRGLVAVGVVFALLHLDPAVRRANPLVFWTAQAATVEEFRANVETLEAKREIAHASLAHWQPAYSGPERHTMGLVIGESTNRWNWQLYGYSRQTTPELSKQEGELLVFKDVLSAASSTVSALRHMLTPRTLQAPSGDEELPSILMLAQAAGYKVFWISNQHDRYITTRFAEEADVQRMLNKGAAAAKSESGVATPSLDEKIFPSWEEALADPAPRKLIIAHLMGAHAHYDLRSPAGFKRFETFEDSVDQQLEAQGRPLWVRTKRDEYDDAMLYQDWVISRLLGSFQSAVGDQSAAWLYTSDHAEEVGHTRDFTGHSPDEAGQVVPLLIWRSAALSADEKRRLEQRPFQSDRLDWTLLNLMHVRTTEDRPQDVLFSASFEAQPRQLHSGLPYRPASQLALRAD